MNNEDKVLGINDDNVIKNKDITKAFNQLILIVMILMFYLNWSTVEVYTRIGKLLPPFTAAILALLVVLNKKTINKNRYQFFLVMIIIIITLIGMIANGSNVGVIFVIANFSLMLLVSSSIKISKLFMRTLSFMFMLFFLYWIIIKPEGFNTNSIGLVTFTTYIGSLFFISSIKRQSLRTSFFLLLTFVAFKAIIISKSRSCLIGFIIFFLLSYIIPKKIWLNKQILKIIYLFITIGSIGFVMIYIYMWDNNISFIIEGITKKFFSGREAIWYELWSLFKDNVIFGLGSNFNLQSHTNLNVHNSMYNILVIYGIPVFILILIQMWKSFSFVCKDNERNKYLVISVAGFISIAIQGFFENTLISVNFIPIILFLLIVVNSNCNVIENSE